MQLAEVHVINFNYIMLHHQNGIQAIVVVITHKSTKQPFPPLEKVEPKQLFKKVVQNIWLNLFERLNKENKIQKYNNNDRLDYYILKYIYKQQLK